MNEAILQEAGLTKAEAALYIMLVKNSPTTPPKLANLVNESRTNTYKLFDSLEAKGLVTRDTTQKKLRYWANSPTSLLDGLKKQRAVAEAAEKQFQNSLPGMMAEYFKYSNQPSVQYFNGTEGLRRIFDDQLTDGKDMLMIHPRGVVDAFGDDESYILRNKFPARGIHRRMFYADRSLSYPPSKNTVSIDESDRAMLIERTWVQEGDLSEPVEWVLYGNKLSIMSLGDEQFGMIIESPQIAASFRQIYNLLDRKVRAEPGYDKLPKHYRYTLIPESLKKIN